ncbi:hypothetical protein [Thalassobius sp. I31.1]|uniref:hypothetical protein n=1 Tax=Thalassobius sp. I31.1 TaxID=2109912 RepID=UPI000D1C1B77|nr:hypothetical protein [Thalassobius sp. I31.1]
MSQTHKDTTQPPSLTIDWEAYLPFFEDADISEAQKRELIETLWGVMTAFVDLGFGIHPVQQACGKTDDYTPDLLTNMLSCDHPKPIETNTTAAQFGKATGKESK